MNRLYMFCLFMMIASFSASTVPAEDPIADWKRMSRMVPRDYSCLKTAQAINIDGNLDDKGWETAAWTDPFVDIEGDAKPAPKHETRAKMLWDDEYFYIAARLTEPHIWGTLREHDCVIFQDNDFEVFIDPDSDNHSYFEMEMNALNTTWDLLLGKPYKDGGPAENGLELKGMKTGVHIDGTLNQSSDKDQAWFVEIAIPWTAFKPYNDKPKEGDSWRVDFSRVEWQIEIVDGKYKKVADTKEDNWVWSPTGIIDMHRPERWGWVQFCDATGKSANSVTKVEKEACDLLHAIYYHQRDFHSKHGKWAGKINELAGLDSYGYSNTIHQASIQTTSEGYEAVVEIDSKRWIIRQDSLVIGTR